MVSQAHRRELLETEYTHTLLEAIGTREIAKPSTTRPKLQVTVQSPTSVPLIFARVRIYMHAKYASLGMVV